MSATPGPWETFEIQTAEDKPSLGIRQGVPGGTRQRPTFFVVTSCGSGNCGPILNDADARLIAGAPDLLEATRLALRHYERDATASTKDLTGRLRAAVAKAEGQESRIEALIQRAKAEGWEWVSDSARILPRVHLLNRAVRLLLRVAIDAIDHAAEIADLHDAQLRLDASGTGEVLPREDELRNLLERLGTIEADLAEIMQRFPAEIPAEAVVKEPM